MKKKPFNIVGAKKGATVVTRDGRTVGMIKKYIDADALKIEIKHHIELMENEPTSYAKARIDEANETLSVIDAYLQQEQPEVDLEKEIVRYTKESLLLPVTNKITPMDIMESDWIKCARHFAEWGSIHLNARKK